MTFVLSPESFSIQNRVVVGVNDTSAAGLLLLNSKAKSDQASATVTASGTPLDLCPAFGSNWPTIHLFNDSETTYIALNASLTDANASIVASALSLFLSEKRVERIIVPVALQFQFRSTKKVYVHNLFEESETTQYPADAPINDSFVASFVNFLRLEEIPTTLLITRGHKFSPSKPSQTKEIIQILGQALTAQVPSFSYDESLFTKLKKMIFGDLL